MAEYDGSVRIITLMNTEKAEEQLEKLENSISKSAGKLSQLSAKMKELEKRKIPTDEYKELQVQLQGAEKSLSDLLNQKNEFESLGLPETTGFAESLGKAEAEVQKIKSEMESLEKSGKAYSGTGADTEDYQKLSEQAEFLRDKMQEQEAVAEKIRERLSEAAAEEERLNSIKTNATVVDQDILDKLERRKQVLQEIADMEKAGLGYGYGEYDNARQELALLNKDVKGYVDDLATVREQFKKLGDSASKAFSAFADGAKKTFSAMKNGAKKAFSAISKGTEKSNKSLGISLKTVLKYTLGIRSLYVLFNKVRSAIKEGFTNLAQYSDTTNKNISALMSSLTQLKNSLATAFAPILTVVTPLLTSFINMLSKAATYVGMLIAALTGQKTFTKATAVQEDYAASLNGTASAAKKAAGALAGFDDLDVLQQQEDAGGGGAGADVADMFDEVAIPNKFQNLADKIKSILMKLFAPLKEAWEREGQYVMDSWRYALNEIWGLTQSIGTDFLKMWQQEETVNIFENILHIIGDIGVIAGNLAHNFREAWEENDTGLHILETIRDIFGDIVQHIRNATEATIKWAKNIDFQPLLEKMLSWLESFKPVVDTIAGILGDFYSTVLLPLSKWVLEKGLPDLLNVFIKFNELVDWEKLRSNLNTFWEYLEPFAETIGEGLIEFIDRCSEALANFVNGETFEDLLTFLKDWMDSISPKNVADGIQGLVVALLALNIACTVVTGLYALAIAFNTVSTAVGVLTGALGIVSGAIGTLAGEVGAFLALVMKNGLVTTMNSLFGTVATTIAGITAVIGGAILAVTNFFSMWQEGFSAAKEILMLLGTALAAVGVVILGAPAVVAGVVAAIVAAVASIAVVIHDNWDSIVEFFVGIGEKFGEALETLKGFVGNAVASLGNFAADALETGKNIVGGLVQGIKDSWNSLKETVSDTALNVITKFKDVLGIHSPSTVMDENGVYLIEGLKNGISSTIDSVFALFAPEQWALIGQYMLEGVIPYIEAMRELFLITFEETFAGITEQTVQFLENWVQLFDSWMSNNKTVYFSYDVWYELFENIMRAYKIVNTEFMTAWKKNMDTWWKQMVVPFFEIAKWQLFGAQMRAGVMNGLKSLVNDIGGLLNKIITMFDAAFKKLESSMNKLISKYNENASKMGTTKLSKVSYSPMGSINIPALASGAVIRGGNPFLALLGDQPRGQTNIEAPLSTIEQAVENALSRSGYGSGLAGQTITIPLNVNGQEFARLTLGDILKEMGRQGYDVEVLGVN